MENISKLKTWSIAARPQTLIASMSPVCIGTALSINRGKFHLGIFFFTLLFSVLIQIGTNFANDYFDFIKGADTKDRKGFLRATQAGLILPNQMKMGFITTFFFAFLSSIYLIFIGGSTFFILMGLSILFGILYTGGPNPLGYVGMGDLLVFFFFGPVTTIGTFYLQTHVLNSTILLSSLAPGCLSTAILVVNNLRDSVEDKKANKKTLVVLLGKKWGQIEYLLCLFVAFFIPLLLFFQDFSWRVLLLWTVFPYCFPLVKQVLFFQESAKLNITLKKTALFLLLYTFVFSMVLL